MNTFKLCVILLFVPSLMFASDVRTLTFGNLEWGVKSSSVPIAPGPNYFGGNEDSVWTDEQGLHLTIRENKGNWYATEIFTSEPVGYGTYTFTVRTPVLRYEPQVVAGFFTWDNDPEEYNREIDIEFAAWGEEEGSTFQYVVQPYTDESRMMLFDPQLQGSVTTHRIVWAPDSVAFSSYHGTVDPDDSASEVMLMERWTYPSSPSEGNAHFRINLWLYRGQKLLAPIQMVLTSFEFEKGRF